MIIFYHKKTGEVIGTIEGRVHDKDTLEKSFIQPDGVSRENIGKYVVPLEIVGNQISLGGPSKELLLDIELGKKSIYEFKVKLDDKGNFAGLESK